MSNFNPTNNDINHTKSTNYNGDPLNSNLQATAPEYVPLNKNQGAVRKKYTRNDHHHVLNQHYYPRDEDTNGGSSQEYSTSKTGGIKKRYFEKKWREKNSKDTSNSSANTSNNYYSQNNDYYDRNNYHNRNRTYYQENKPQQSSYYSDNNGSKKYNNYSRNNNRNNDYYYHEDTRNNKGSKPKNLDLHVPNNNNNNSRNNIGENFLDQPINYESYIVDKKNPIENIPSASQRERLTEMIDGNLLECLVCCEKIKRSDKIWSCSQCYHIIHLICVNAWAKSSKIEENWRCPACQQFYSRVPQEYFCYCGKTIDPKINPNLIAHGCDNVCLKKGKNCQHKCSILCHPGPCPECNIVVSKPCGCGKTQQSVRCCSEIQRICLAICTKLLNCGYHQCEANCHETECSPCKETIIQECYCGKTGRKVKCTQETIDKTNFNCENECDKLLSCGNHKCKKKCHSGPCDRCSSDISVIKTCYCGKTKLTEATARSSCFDPIPTCNNICGKNLICGPPNKPHTCREKCHEGLVCPNNCDSTTIVRCRCGHMDKEIECRQLKTKADEVLCERKCTKKRLCGKHTCKQKCCIEFEHFCPLPCNKTLSCGLHKCELTCHSGRCPACMETSFDELYCECRSSVLYPPISCGTKPPACTKQCFKARQCGHPSNHECHAGPCPACFVLTKQWCYGAHEQRATIPCSQQSFSCGLPCGKAMLCGRHKCNKPCHDGKCPMPCTQSCLKARKLCGHPCGRPCHDAACPDVPCKHLVPVTCLCGLQKLNKVCIDLTEEYVNLEMSRIKDRISNSSSNQYQSNDLSLDSSVTMHRKPPTILRILDCNEECRVYERNRRLAIDLQIQNPDLSQKLTPRYSDFLKQWAKKDGKFCLKVHDKLSELVQLAKQSKQKSRSYSFESMNRDKRHFIHEYCEYFGVESAAYDAEPNRNVVATAIKDKSWLPGMSLLEVLQRENGQRKVPGPVVLNYAGMNNNNSNDNNERVTLKLLNSSKRD